VAAFDPLRLLETLVDHEVEFIVIGQIAAVLHGHPETTVDLDILPKQAFVNAERLAGALRSLHAHHVGGNIDRVPIGVDDRDFIGWREIRSFDTDSGRIDVIPAAAGIGTFDDNRADAVEVDLDGFAVFVAPLEVVIASKEAAGRPKDLRRLPGLREFLNQVQSDRGEPTT
jgi:predicted nucleotidyltransferase